MESEAEKAKKKLLKILKEDINFFYIKRVKLLLMKRFSTHKINVLFLFKKKYKNHCCGSGLIQKENSFSLNHCPQKKF